MYTPTVKIQGIKNPASVVFKVLRDAGCSLDTASFEKIKGQVGDHAFNTGFIVQTIEDLNRLCEIGNFAVIFEDGYFKAVMSD